MACLWKAGYAVTDPGFSFYHPELRMFDPVSQEGRQLLYAFTEGLSGACDGSCQVCVSVSAGFVTLLFRTYPTCYTGKESLGSTPSCSVRLCTWHDGNNQPICVWVTLSLALRLFCIQCAVSNMHICLYTC